MRFIIRALFFNRAFLKVRAGDGFLQRHVDQSGTFIDKLVSDTLLFKHLLLGKERSEYSVADTGMNSNTNIGSSQ